MELFLGLAPPALAEVAARARLSHLAKNATVFARVSLPIAAMRS